MRPGVRRARRRGGGRRYCWDLGGFAGMGDAASVGRLSVPENWGWAATAPAGLRGPAASLCSGVDLARGGYQWRQGYQ